MRTSDSITKISAALAKALPEIQHATKDAKNPHFRSSYASLPAVIDTAKPVLAQHGVVVLQSPGWDGDRCTLTTRLLHESGEWIEGEAGSPVAKMDPQGIGSAITYLRRYSLAAMTGIGQEDDDGNAASGGGRDPQTGQKRPESKPKPQASTEDPSCPKCAGPLWDDRTGKKNPKAPDWKCKDKDGCGWALWLDSARQDLKAAVEALELADTVPAGSTKRIMDGVAGGDLEDLRRAQDWVNSKRTSP